ncbi:phosphotransferase family enzyme [Paenibacillus taihuensis]|uniref:Phosphotransferase family enzyme n=1 Tax=Paenibacillus taihuensis TaxID=1156355 RepID=A0A3D9SIR3_9BACL|nr:aminoglycoside phosphotransferase family protein [Paenibacillus taihuensis]REE88909.1 phosphotransferase family enzyme [Paenibacillus taihuensis]
MTDTVVAQAERIAADFLPEQAITHSYRIVDKGIDNQVCVVGTEQRKVVVRMNDQASYPSYIKEKWCIEQAITAGIPGPEVLSIGIANDSAYMILEYIHGDNGMDSSAPRSEVWRMLGEYAPRMHTIGASGFGRNLAEPDHGQFLSPPHAGSDGSWLGFVQHNINSLTEHDPLIKLGVLTWKQSQLVRELFERLKGRSFRFGLNHGDLSIKNTIVGEAGLVSVIDWGNAEVDVVPHATIAQVLMYHMLGIVESPNEDEFNAFLDGYGLSEEDLVTTRQLLLLRAFDNLRWAIDRCPERIESFASIAKQVVEAVIHE